MAQRSKRSNRYCRHDLLYFDGEDVSQYPLVARKEALRRILRKTARGRIRYTEHIEEEGERLFAQLEAMQLERMVANGKIAFALQTVAEGENCLQSR